MSMMIMGYERSNFTTKDGTKVTGYNVYVKVLLLSGFILRTGS